MTIVCFANDGFVAIPVLFQFGTTESGILRVFYIFVCYLERTKITDQVIAARLNKVFVNGSVMQCRKAVVSHLIQYLAVVGYNLTRPRR